MWAVRDTISNERICLTPDRDRAEAVAWGDQHVVEFAFDAKDLLWWLRPKHHGADPWAEHRDHLQRLVFSLALDNLVAEFRAAAIEAGAIAADA